MTTSLRQAVRDEIRAELEKQKPIADARLSLELIAETSVRLLEDDGPVRYQVVDDRGQPRTIEKDGQVVDFTIQDLTAELRRKYPTLFEPTPETSAEGAAPAIEPADAPGEQDAGSGPVLGRPVDASAAEPQPVSRDWLMLGSGDMPAANPATTGLDLRQRWRRSLDTIASRARPARQALAAKVGGLRDLSWQDRARSAATSLAARLPQVRLPQTRRPEERPGGAPQPKERPPRQRYPQLRGRYRYGLAAGALALLIGALLYGVATRAPDKPAARSGTEARSGTAAPPATRTSSPATGAPSPVPAGPAPADPGPITGVPEVIDTATLRIDGKLIRLFGVEWARGGQKEDLTRYLGSREVACQPAQAPNLYRCAVEGHDLSEVVLFNGGGRATSEASAELVAAENHAKAEKIGVWRK